MKRIAMQLIIYLRSQNILQSPGAVSLQTLFALCCSLALTLAFEVGYMQYYFLSKDKMHDSWILATYEDYHMWMCARRCQYNEECSGVGLGPLEEDLGSHMRMCYLLANIDEAECMDDDSGCKQEGVQIYTKQQIRTTTEISSTTSVITTTTESTSTKEPTTTTSTEKPTTKKITTTTQTITTSITSVASEEKESTTTTREATTTVKPTTSTISKPIETTIATTTTTSKPTTITTIVQPTTTSTEKATSSEPTSTSEKSDTTTTERATTSTEKPATATSTTTTYSPTTTSSITSTTSEGSTTTTTKATTTTQPGATTTEELIQTTEAETSTTLKPTTTTTEGETTTTTTSAPTTTTEKEPEEAGACTAQPANITCEGSTSGTVVYGLTSTFPLFTDASISVKCSTRVNENIFKPKATKKAYEPFSGTFTCEDNEVMLGLEMCFQVEVKYIAPFCVPIEDEYELLTDDIQTVKTTEDDKTQVICPDKSQMLTLRLVQYDNGDIDVKITCVGIGKKSSSGAMRRRK